MSDAPASPDAPFPKRARWFWLRVAVSTFFGLLTVALCVLWLRSYKWQDIICLTRDPATFVRSNNCYLSLYQARGNQPPVNDNWLSSGEMNHHIGEWWYMNDSTGFYLSIPHWFVIEMLVVCGLGLAVIAGIQTPRHFSLRTLLIATTLLAVVFGLMIWTLRS